MKTSHTAFIAAMVSKLKAFDIRRAKAEADLARATEQIALIDRERAGVQAAYDALVGAPAPPVDPHAPPPRVDLQGRVLPPDIERFNADGRGEPLGMPPAEAAAQRPGISDRELLMLTPRQIRERPLTYAEYHERARLLWVDSERHMWEWFQRTKPAGTAAEFVAQFGACRPYVEPEPWTPPVPEED